MSLVASAVELSGPAERGDAPDQDVLFAILLAFSEHGPVRTLFEVSSYSVFDKLAGFEDIEHEDSAWAKRFIKMLEKSPELISAVGLVEAIIQTFADGSNG